jgi:hypothetical protein
MYIFTHSPKDTFLHKTWLPCHLNGDAGRKRFQVHIYKYPREAPSNVPKKPKERKKKKEKCTKVLSCRL